VEVFGGNVEGAIRTLKKRSERSGLFKEMKARVAYLPPSQKRRLKSAKARAQLRKAAKRRALFEGNPDEKRPPMRRATSGVVGATHHPIQERTR
jgi:small subunit ribosomal protein S21